MLLRPEPPAYGPDSMRQGFLLSCVLPIRGSSPHLRLPKSPGGPSTCLCPSSFSHRLVPTPLAWLGKESALLFIVIHTEEGEQLTQTQCLPVSTLTHPSSISWLQKQTRLLSSHAGCNDFTPELQRCCLPYSATLSHSFHYAFFVVVVVVSSHRGQWQEDEEDEEEKGDVK